jgi:hypothetical protein
MATQDSPSLYERLGGVYSIATVVDDFCIGVAYYPVLARPISRHKAGALPGRLIKLASTLRAVPA